MLFYRMMLQRGDKSGITRAVGETPYEYAQTISTEIDTMALDERPVVDVETVTEKFIEARYSTHDIDAESARAVGHSWERIRRELRQIRR